MKTKLFVTSILLISVTTLLAQTGNVEIARWKNNATAAYSIISDDINMPFYGDIDYIVSTTAERGIHMSFAMITATGYHYTDSKNKLFPAGHGFVTHSTDHGNHENTPDTLSWLCDSSQADIERNIPGSECMFLANWGGMNTTGVVDYLKTKRFIGCRGIGATGSGVNSYDFDPFAISTYFYQNGGEATLEQKLNDVIAQGGFAQLSFHYIGGSVSWGYILANNWETHLDNVKTRMDANELWVETVQRVIKYRMEREYYTVAIESENDDSMVVSFDTSAEINSSAHVDNSTYNEPLTLIITDKFGHEQIMDADPFGGNVTIYYNSSGIDSALQGGKQVYPVPEISLVNYEIEIPFQVNEYDIAVSSNTLWEASTDADWVTLISSSGQGNGTLSFTVSENSYQLNREAVISITDNALVSKNLKVTQLEGAQLVVNETEFDVGINGDVLSLLLVANYPWELVASDTWISTNPSSGTDAASVSITVEANSGVPRTGTLELVHNSVAYQTVTITQDGSATNTDFEAALNGMQVFPNPANNFLTVRNIPEKSIVSVFDMGGKQLFQSMAVGGEMKLEVSGYAKGFYLLSVSNKNEQVNRVILVN